MEKAAADAKTSRIWDSRDLSGAMLKKQTYQKKGKKKKKQPLRNEKLYKTFSQNIEHLVIQSPGEVNGL